MNNDRPTPRYQGVPGYDFLDELRPRIGGMPVYISRGMGYDEAVIVDQNAGKMQAPGEPAPFKPAVLVNHVNALRLAHPTLDVWDALRLALTIDIERAAERAMRKLDPA